MSSPNITGTFNSLEQIHRLETRLLVLPYNETLRRLALHSLCAVVIVECKGNLVLGHGFIFAPITRHSFKGHPLKVQCFRLKASFLQVSFSPTYCSFRRLVKTPVRHNTFYGRLVIYTTEFTSSSIPLSLLIIVTL